MNLSELGDLDDFLDTSNGVNVTHIKAFDFFKDINREVENLIGDQNDQYINYFLSLYHYIILCKLCLHLN